MPTDDGAPEPLPAPTAPNFRATLLTQAVRVLCKAVSVVVLARLVSPADHGLFAMAASVTYLLVLFRDLGLGTAAVQARELTEEQRTTLLWLHVGLGAVLTVATVVLVPGAAAFFQEARIQPLLAVMSVSFLLIGLNAWPRVLLFRDLRIAEVSRLETWAAVGGTLAMLLAGVAGAGAYSFAVFLLVSEAIALLAAWRICRWRPSAPARWASVRPLVHTGASLTGYNLLVYVAQQIDTLLMGKWFGALSLGLYSRPNQLLALPTLHLATPLTQVLLATLAREPPSSPAFARHVRETANLIAHLTLPLAVVCAVLPHEVVRLVLGTAWPDAAPLLRWLAASAAVSYLTATLYAVGVASGHARRLAVMAAVSLLTITCGVWVGRRYGPMGFAAGLAAANLALFVPRLWWGIHGTPVRLPDYFAAFFGPFGLGLALAGGMVAGREFAGPINWLERLGVALLGGAVAAGLLAALWPRLRTELRNVWRLRPRLGNRSEAESGEVAANDSDPLVAPAVPCRSAQRGSGDDAPAVPRTGMRVGLDTNGVYVSRAGVARYVRGLTRGLAQTDTPGLDVFPLAWEVENFAFRQPARMLKTAYREFYWGPVVAPRILRERQADLLHSTSSLFIRRPAGVRHVVTLHDLSLSRHPERFRPWQIRSWHRRVPVILAADRVICISRFTADESIQLLGLPAAKIDIVYNGCDWHEDERPLTESPPDCAVPGEFHLFVGSLEPGKNLHLLRAAYAAAAVRGRRLPPLLIVGVRREGVAHEGEPPGDWHFLGWQPDAVLLYLYRRAHALVFPSIYEGFGLPVIEAMALGCPVICSPTASLPEVAGDAAFMGPLEATWYADAMELLVAQPALRADFIARGRVNARRFSWRRCATETAAVYGNALRH
jgi:PST family polysaccharide transporter